MPARKRKSMSIKINKLEGSKEIELIRNKRKGLKLKISDELKPGYCQGCILEDVNETACRALSSCQTNAIIYTRLYEDNQKRISNYNLQE